MTPDRLIRRRMLRILSFRRRKSADTISCTVGSWPGEGGQIAAKTTSGPIAW